MYIGLDLGTSGVKALLMDAAQTVIGSAQAKLSVDHPHSGWAEQNPAEWINASQDAMSALCARYPAEMSAVKGIGLSGQMHGATLLDDRDDVLRPCILWNDTRSHIEAARLDAMAEFRILTGNIVFPGFTAPKLLWVHAYEPEVFKRTRCVLLPKDYLRLWLSGEAVSDVSDASGTGWLNVAKRRWSDDLLTVCGLDQSYMPDLVEGTQPCGWLRRELMAQWGMAGPVVIAGGGGDNAASAVGVGAVSEGQAFLSLGTSGVVFAATDAYRPNPESAIHTFCHALPGQWHQMGVILTAAATLSWWAGVQGANEAELINELGAELQAPGRTLFLPYLAGERTPHNSADARGAFLGLEGVTSQADMTRAIMEGVAYALRDNLAGLNRAGTQIERVTAVGGGSRSDYWLRVIATALGIDVDIPEQGDFGAAFGAARLGLIAATGAPPKSVCRPVDIRRTIEPDPALTQAFADGYERFRAAFGGSGL